MKRVVLLLLSLILFIITPFSALAHTIKPENSTGFSPQDIELRDDAFHGGGVLPLTEWWYFDAVFDNGYSAEMSVRVLGAMKHGFVFSRLAIYNEGRMVANSESSYSMKEFSASVEVPLVQINNKTVITGTYDNGTGNFVYNVSFDFPQSAVMLHFVGCTKGWKQRQQAGDWWAVVLPRADVIGTITVENSTMNVAGNGYHDHNWDVTTRMCLNFGWFRGRLNSLNYTATWSAILPTRTTVKPMLVINEKNGGYLDIPAEMIWFSAKDIHLDHGMLIPYFFNVGTMTDEVFLMVNMQVVSVHHDRFMGFMSYWRYHVKCTGTIIMNGHTELVDGMFIVGLLRFR